MQDLAKRIEQLEALLAVALARIAELEEQLRQHSGNSSKPPSSDLGRRKPPKNASGRKTGGQPGHTGTTREIVPPEQVDEVVNQDPETCANCGSPLEAAPRIDADIRQIVETPEFRTLVREFRLWKKRCPRCGGFTRGKMPPGSPKGAFGPRIQATVAMLSGRFRLSRREARVLMRLMTGVEMSLGSVQACCEVASEAMKTSHEALHAEVKASQAVHADETGFVDRRNKGAKRWMARNQRGSPGTWRVGWGPGTRSVERSAARGGAPVLPRSV